MGVFDSIFDGARSFGNTIIHGVESAGETVLDAGKTVVGDLYQGGREGVSVVGGAGLDVIKSGAGLVKTTTELPQNLLNPSNWLLIIGGGIALLLVLNKVVSDQGGLKAVKSVIKD